MARLAVICKIVLKKTQNKCDTTANLNVISDVLRDGECGSSKKSLTANKTFSRNQTFRIYWV